MYGSRPRVHIPSRGRHAEHLERHTKGKRARVSWSQSECLARRGRVEPESVNILGKASHAATYLIHLEKRPLPHLLQCTHLSGVLFPRQKDLSIAALANLCDYMELINLEFSTSASENDAFAPRVRFEFGGMLCGS